MRHFCLLSPDVFLECDVLCVEAGAQAEEDQRGPGLQAGLGWAHGGEEAGGGRGLALGVPGGHGDQVGGVALQGPSHVPGQWSASDNPEQTGHTHQWADWLVSAICLIVWYPGCVAASVMFR